MGASDLDGSRFLGYGEYSRERKSLAPLDRPPAFRDAQTNENHVGDKPPAFFTRAEIRFGKTREKKQKQRLTLVFNEREGKPNHHNASLGRGGDDA
jgi:hypothetical protein